MINNKRTAEMAQLINDPLCRHIDLNSDLCKVVCGGMCL